MTVPGDLPREHRFELVEVGEEFGPRTVIVDEPRMKAFAFAQDDYCSWHFEDSPFGGPVAHASILANELMQIYFERYRIDAHDDGGGAGDGGGAWLEEAHVEETLWFENPLPVGEPAELRGRFVDKYVVNGRGAVVLEGDARGRDGRMIVRHRAVEYFRMDGPAEDDGRREPPLRQVQREPAADLAAASVEAAAPGTSIPPLVKTISFPQLLVYSTLEHPDAQRSIHTDYAIAARAGLPAPLVQGQQLACHIAAAMSRFFGAAWYRGGEVRIKFLGAVCAGETIRVGGVVRDRAHRGSEDVLDLDVWIEDGSGAAVAVANASCAVPAKRGHGDG